MPQSHHSDSPNETQDYMRELVLDGVDIHEALQHMYSDSYGGAYVQHRETGQVFKIQIELQSSQMVKPYHSTTEHRGHV